MGTGRAFAILIFTVAMLMAAVVLIAVLMVMAAEVEPAEVHCTAPMGDGSATPIADPESCKRWGRMW